MSWFFVEYFGVQLFHEIQAEHVSGSEEAGTDTLRK